MSMAADDPFACFGDDDDSESDIDDDNEQSPVVIDDHGEELARPGYTGAKQSSSNDCAAAVAASADRDRGRHLTEAFNAKKKDGAHHRPDLLSRAPPIDEKSPADVDAASSLRSSYRDQRARTASLPWPRRPPLYLGPMRLSDDLEEGGGRGYVASRDLPPGTCVLIEEPLVRGWGAEQTGKRLGLESIRYLLEREDAQAIVECMEELHPMKRKVDLLLCETGTKSAEASSLDKLQIVDMMSDDGDGDVSREAKSLIAYASERNVTNADGSALAERDVRRLLLALRYNGFDSGLYLHFSMFNHDEDPNCVKFRPEGSPRSEARTTRRVREGEALSLHYVENPREVSHATRRRILFDQHRFDIGDEHEYKHFLDATMAKTGQLLNDNERRNHIFESELVRGRFPSSTRDGSIGAEAGTGENGDDLPATHRIEKSLDDLEQMLEELRAAFWLNSRANGNVDDESFDRAAALELTLWELIIASRSALGNDNHVLLSRCRRLHLDVVELVLSRRPSSLTEKQSVELVARFLPSAEDLLASQRRRLGEDHPDVARTHGDSSMGIQALLSHGPKRLLSLNLEGMETLDLCSRVEHSRRMEKNRIEGLYPRDVDELLESVKEK